MIDITNIDDLISKFLSGEATPEEAMLLEDWKQQDPSNLDHYVHCRRAFEAIAPYQQLDQVIDTAAAWKKVKPQLKNSKAIQPIRETYYFRIAASVAVLIGMGVVFYLLQGPSAEKNNYYQASQHSRAIELTDGTCIIIAPNSTLTLDKDFGKSNRLLHLNGSAYFSVAHKKDLPLIVDAGKVYIKDIGTQYNVITSANSDTVYVHVDEGVISLSDNLGSETIIKASESAFYIKSKKQITVNPTDETIRERSKGIMRFNFIDTKLSEVIQNLSKEYHTSIELEKKSLENCTITSKFYDEDLETILSIIVETLELTYEKNDHGFIIKGEKCRH